MALSKHGCHLLTSRPRPTQGTGDHAARIEACDAELARLALELEEARREEAALEGRREALGPHVARWRECLRREGELEGRRCGARGALLLAPRDRACTESLVQAGALQKSSSTWSQQSYLSWPRH
jgi:hypothetical protein